MTEAAPGRAFADTNIFVALFVGPTHPLHEPALDLFRRVANGELVLILTPVIVIELGHVCRTVFGWDRERIIDRLGNLLRADNVEVRERDVLRATFDLFTQHRSLDLPDAYLAANALAIGPTVVASFDRGIDSVEGIARIST